MKNILCGIMTTEGTRNVPKLSSDLAKTLTGRSFDPDKFAKSISAHSDGDKDLQEYKQRILSLGEETAQILKKQVYRNYQQFIDTAKEISYLEGEMFQLNNILTEQKDLMEEMITMFAIKNDVKKDESKVKKEDKEQEQRKVMSALVGKIEGCQNVVEMPGRYLVHDGDLLELDLESFSHIEKVHLFLFNDCAMLTTQAGVRRGNATSGKYKFQVLWEIDKLAAVNARDVGRKKIPAKTAKSAGRKAVSGIQAVKNAFKVLAFPDSRMFQCENPKEKREWLEIIDETKRKHLSDREKNKDLVTTPSPLPKSPSYANPFASFDGSPKRESSPVKKDFRDERLFVEWLQEMPEDLDVFIAQRYFEQAVDLIQKTKLFLSDIHDSPLKTEIVSKLNNRTQQLIDVLSRELKSTPDHSLRGGPRLITKPVVLLIKLEETAKACNLFLSNRSNAISFAIRHLRTEGSLSLYIGKLCNVFFSNLEETGVEFSQAFEGIHGCFSSYVLWAQNEISSFVDTFSKQVFAGNADIMEIAECVQNAQGHCTKLHRLGLDLDFQLNLLLSPSIEATLLDHKRKIIDATKLRNSEEMWKPTNMNTPQALEKLLEEMNDLDLKNFAEYCFDECFVQLTSSTLSFTKAIINHVDSCIKMMLPELQRSVLSGIVEILTVFTDFTSGCLRSEAGRLDKLKMIRNNAKFLIECVMPLLEQKVQKKILQPPFSLIQLREKFSNLVEEMK